MHTIVLTAPLDGVILPLEQVPDPVFSQKMVGDGISLDPLSEVLLAPCPGTVTQVHRAGHAVTLTTPEGIELMMHIGLDTVNLKGEGFTAKVSEGQTVSPGDPLIAFDADFLATHAKSLLTQIVVTNGERVAAYHPASGLVHAGADTLLTLDLAEGVGDEQEVGGRRVVSEAVLIPNPTGLHARPAAVLANLAKKYKSKVLLQRGDDQANAKSVVSIMGIEIAQGDKVVVVVEWDCRRGPQHTGRVVPMRLQKFLSRAGVASRRGSEDLMTAGRVTVNGVVETTLGTRVDPTVDEVAVDGAVVTIEYGPVYRMLHKPAGYLTTMSDPQGRRTVAEMMPPDIPGLFPVGRLDADTTGLLLLTTDGELGHRLMHPSFHVSKRYLADVEGVPSDASLARLRAGVTLEDGPTKPAKVAMVAAGDDAARIELSISEGRKHQVKRMLQHIGHPVTKLHRESFGPLELDELPAGKSRELLRGRDRPETSRSCRHGSG